MFNSVSLHFNYPRTGHLCNGRKATKCNHLLLIISKSKSNSIWNISPYGIKEQRNISTWNTEVAPPNIVKDMDMANIFI